MKNFFLIAAAVIAVLALSIAGYYWYFFGGGEISVQKSQPATTTSDRQTVPQPEEVVVQATSPEKFYAPGEVVTLAEPESLPEQEELQSFLYDPAVGKLISVSGMCSDAYWAFLVFHASEDYRKNPGAARVNRASECPAAKTFKTQFDLRDFNLPAGTYYFLVADQGEMGSWYNPR